MSVRGLRPQQNIAVMRRMGEPKNRLIDGGTRLANVRSPSSGGSSERSAGGQKKEARPKPGFLRPLTAGDSWGANLFGGRSVARRAGAFRAGSLSRTGAGETEGFVKRGDEFVHGVVLGVDASALVRLT
jgi:hypothetical protein